MTPLLKPALPGTMSVEPASWLVQRPSAPITRSTTRTRPHRITSVAVLSLIVTTVLSLLPVSPASASRRLRVKGRVSTVAAAPAAPVAMVASGPVPTAPMVADLFSRINADRQANGLPAVRWDDRLGGLAGTWAQDMSVNGFRHRDLGAVGIGQGQYADVRVISENIAMGSLVDTGALHDLLMRSPGHRANTLDGDVDIVGIGAVCDAKGQLWIAVNFAGDGAGGVPDNPNGAARATGASGGPRC